MDEAVTHLFAYCERAGDPGFWGEPLNAITNLAFIWCAMSAAGVCKRVYQLPWRRYWDVWLLVFSMIAIGIGSGLWHTVATPWSVVADVIPIYVFINIYIFTLFIRIIGLSFWETVFVWGLFQGVNMGFEIYAPADALNGSILYVPTYCLLIVAIIWMNRIAHVQWKQLGNITVLFTLSLVFRTADWMVCDIFPIGTHFMWHLLNAFVLFQLIGLVCVNEAVRQNKNTTQDQP